MTDLYTSGRYLETNPDYHQEHSAWKARHVLRLIERNKLAVSSVCDLGCGAGRVLKELQEALPAGTKLHGYDISPGAITLASELCNEGLTFEIGDGLTGERCDLLLLMDVLEHLEDYYAFLRSVRPRSAYHIIHVPLDFTALTAMRPRLILNPRRNVGHLHFFTRELFLAVLQDCGYEIVDHMYTATAVDLRQKAMGGRIARLPRKLMYKLAPDFTVRTLGGFSLMVLAKS